MLSALRRRPACRARMGGAGGREGAGRAAAQARSRRAAAALSCVAPGGRLRARKDDRKLQLRVEPFLD